MTGDIEISKLKIRTWNPKLAARTNILLNTHLCSLFKKFTICAGSLEQTSSAYPQSRHGEFKSLCNPNIALIPRSWIAKKEKEKEKKNPCNNHSYTIDQKQMLKPFNFPGHSTGANLIFATTTNKKQAGRCQRAFSKPSRAGWLAKATFPSQWAEHRWCNGHYQSQLCYSTSVFFFLYHLNWGTEIYAGQVASSSHLLTPTVIVIGLCNDYVPPHILHFFWEGKES